MAKFRYVFWLREFLRSQQNLLFEWDEGNSDKSEQKHGVTAEMVESCFRDNLLCALGEQYEPVISEIRYGILAKAKTGEILFVCFAIRDRKIRPISARKASKKERKFYEEEIC